MCRGAFSGRALPNSAGKPRPCRFSSTASPTMAAHACAHCQHCVGFACPVDAKNGTFNTLICPRPRHRKLHPGNRARWPSVSTPTDAGHVDRRHLLELRPASEFQTRQCRRRRVPPARLKPPACCSIPSSDLPTRTGLGNDSRSRRTSFAGPLLRQCHGLDGRSRLGRHRPRHDHGDHPSSATTTTALSAAECWPMISSCFPLAT